MRVAIARVQETDNCKSAKANEMGVGCNVLLRHKQPQKRNSNNTGERGQHGEILKVKRVSYRIMSVAYESSNLT